MSSIDNIQLLIQREVNRAVESILESRLDQDENKEQKRQDDLSKAIDARKLRASDQKKEVDEAEDDNPEDESGKREDRTGGKGTADSKKADLPNKKILKNPSLDSVIDKLNIVRGGKSLKDPEVKKSFQNYLGTLNTREKQTMLVFLTAISQILTGKKVGADALDPADVGLRIKSTEKIKTSDSPKETTGKSPDSSAPIVVGESQDKSKIARAIAEYRRNS